VEVAWHPITVVHHPTNNSNNNSNMPLAAAVEPTMDNNPIACRELAIRGTAIPVSIRDTTEINRFPGSRQCCGKREKCSWA
jgi:hypothetical protein